MEQTKAGTLYLVATPIGNLEDITLRAIRILKEVDLICAEDTRNSRKLLDHYGIDTPMTSYHEHNKIEKVPELMNRLLSGQDLAVITDAGTPGISDPGEELVAAARKESVTVTAIPGAAACVTALSISGKSSRRFAFEAFLPTDKKKRKAVLEEMARETRTTVVYEAPHHLAALLEELLPVLGADRRISICRELTKKFEEIWETTLGEAVQAYASGERTPKGEYVLVIAGKSFREMQEEAQAGWQELSLEEHMEFYELQGIDHKEAMKRVAADRGIGKRDVYKALLNRKEDTHDQALS